MGRKYVAYAVIEYDDSIGYEVVRHGLIFPPEIGDTINFGSSLKQWESEFQMFLQHDLEVDLWGVERFTYRPGSQGQASEDINLRIAGMQGLGARNIRNTDWKSWFSRTVHKGGTEEFFGFPTPHECDAAGIAMYTACKRVEFVKPKRK